MTKNEASTSPDRKTGSAVDSALNEILRIIQDRKLPPGDQIPSEGKLAEQCEVGRGTIREAVKALAQLGVLIVRNGRRAEIAEFSGDNLAILINHAIQTAQVSVLQTWDFRQTIEIRIARLAALHRTSEQIEDMRAICDQMRSAIGNPIALTRTDINLHLSWAVAAGNPLFLLNMQSLKIVMDRTGPVGYAALVEKMALERHVELHIEITEAIAEQRADDAGSMMLDHFIQPRNYLLDAGLN